MRSSRETGNAGRVAAGRYLAELRHARGLSQGDLAATLSGVDKTFISQIENGRAPCPSYRMADLAAALGVTASELGRRLIGFYDPYMHAVLFDAPQASKAVAGQTAVRGAQGNGRDIIPSLTALALEGLAGAPGGMRTLEVRRFIEGRLGREIHPQSAYLVLSRLVRLGSVERHGSAWCRIVQSSSSSTEDPRPERA